MNPVTNVLVRGGHVWQTPPDVRDQRREERTTVAPQRRGKSGLKRLHDSLAKERRSGACTSSRAVGCSLDGSARDLKLRMHRVFSRKTGPASGALHDDLNKEARCTGW